MNRLTTIDRWLLFPLVALWAVCFGLTTRDMVVGTATPSIFVASANEPGGYPVMLGFVPWWHGEDSHLRSGDRLLSVGDRSLAGVGPVSFRGLVAETTGQDQSLRVTYERDGTRHTTTLASGNLAFDWPLVPTSLAFGLTAILLLLRAPPSNVVRAFFAASLVAATALVSLFGRTVPEVQISFCLTLVTSALVGPIGVLTALHFVGRTQGAWARFGPWIFLVGGVPHVARIFATPISAGAGNLVALAVSLAWGGTILTIFTRAYRRLDEVRRRRLKWILLGLYIGFVPMMIASAATAIDPSLLWLYEDAIAGFLVLPVFVLVAVSRHHLFDVDRLISATVSYSVLITVGSAVGFAAIPALAEATADRLGFDPLVGHLAFGFALASVVVTVNRRFSPWLYERFFPESHALATGVHGLLHELERCDGVGEVARVSGAHLNALLRPDVCAIWGRGDDHFQPLFLRGSANPPSLSSSARGTRVLAHAHRALRRSEMPELPPAEQAWLTELRAEVLVPVVRDEVLQALVVLGKKRSEAPYSDEDLALLTTLAEAVSSEIAPQTAQGVASSTEVRALRERQRALDADLHAAAEVQRSHLPAELPELPDVHFAWEFSPCEAVGGDLLQVHAIDDRHVAFYVVDVSGHGVAAALLSVSIAERLSPGEELLTEAPANLDRPRARPPARVLEDLDARYPMERSTKFFTIFYAVYDRETRRLRYSCGGHPPPVLLRADGSFEAPDAGGTIIGLGGLTAFEEGEITLRPGDRLFVYSDGVTETTSPSGEMYGEARLQTSLGGAARSTVAEACAAVLADTRAFRASGSQEDDVTILGVEFGPRPEHHRPAQTRHASTNPAAPVLAATRPA